MNPELLKPIIYAVAAIVLLYLIYQAVKATLAISLFVISISVLAAPFFVFITSVVLAIYYYKPEHGRIEIYGYSLGGKYSFIIIIIGMLASALLSLFILKNRLFKKAFSKINPPPPPDQSTKTDVTHLSPR